MNEHREQPPCDFCDEPAWPISMPAGLLQGAEVMMCVECMERLHRAVGRVLARAGVTAEQYVAYAESLPSCVRPDTDRKLQ